MTGSVQEVSCSFTVPALADVRYVSDNDIVPEQYQNQLMFWRDMFSRGCFAIGDIANDLVSRAAEQRFPVTQQRIFDAVGKFCGRTGRTVRYYAETAAFYPEDARVEFDELPFSHLVFARSLGDKWREVLEFAKLTPSCSREYLAHHFLSDYRDETEEELCDKKTVCGFVSQDGVGENSQDGKNFSESQTEEKKYNPANYRLLSTLANLVDGLDVLVENGADLSEEIRTDLQNCSTVIRRHIPEIAKCIAKTG